VSTSLCLPTPRSPPSPSSPSTSAGEEKRKLEEIIQDFGLEVPYKSRDKFREECLTVETRDVNGNLSPPDQHSDRIEGKEEFVLQLREDVAGNLDNIVERVETSGAARLIKSVIAAVSFRREDNVKHEVELAKDPVKEDLSMEHYQRLEDAFELHGGGKGFLSKTELRSCLRTLGHNPTQEELNRFMAKVDVDHSGALDFDEFFNLMSDMMCGWEPREDLGICWRALDTKGSGGISVGELVVLLHRYGARMDREEILEIFQDIPDTVAHIHHLIPHAGRQHSDQTDPAAAAQRLTAAASDSLNVPLPPRQFHGSSHKNLRLFETRSDYHEFKRRGHFAKDYSMRLEEPGESVGAARPAAAAASSITFDQFYVAVVKPSSGSEES